MQFRARLLLAWAAFAELSCYLLRQALLVYCLLHLKPWARQLLQHLVQCSPTWAGLQRCLHITPTLSMAIRTR